VKPVPIKYKNLPPKEAIDYFRRKGYALGFDWQDQIEPAPNYDKK